MAEERITEQRISEEEVTDNYGPNVVPCFHNGIRYFSRKYHDNEDPSDFTRGYNAFKNGRDEDSIPDFKETLKSLSKEFNCDLPIVIQYDGVVQLKDEYIESKNVVTKNEDQAGIELLDRCWEEINEENKEKDHAWLKEIGELMKSCKEEEELDGIDENGNRIVYSSMNKTTTGNASWGYPKKPSGNDPWPWNPNPRDFVRDKQEDENHEGQIYNPYTDSWSWL